MGGALTPPPRRAPKALPLDLVVARFCALYPGEFQGGAIQAPLFYLLARRMGAVVAFQRLQMGHAVAGGVALVLGGEKARDVFRTYREEASGAS